MTTPALPQTSHRDWEVLSWAGTVITELQDGTFDRGMQVQRSHGGGTGVAGTALAGRGFLRAEPVSQLAEH